MASLDSGGLIFSQDSLLASRAENGLMASWGLIFGSSGLFGALMFDHAYLVFYYMNNVSVCCTLQIK